MATSKSDITAAGSPSRSPPTMSANRPASATPPPCCESSATRQPGCSTPFSDGLYVAAEQLVGPQTVEMLDSRADQIVPELTSDPSWPTLRAHLLALAAETGEHPLLHLQAAAAGRELHTAGDMAAVLDWRRPEPAPTDPGPLPWLPGIPEALHNHPGWGRYLAQRAELIADLAAHVRRDANDDSTPPVWATPGSQPSVALIGEVEVWRAANAIDRKDHPTHRSRTTCRPRPPSGNTTSTEVSRTAATTSVG